MTSRRLVLAVEDARLCGELAELLARENVEVLHAPDLDESALDELGADAVVLRGRATERRDLADLVGNPDEGPGVVVLDDPARTTRATRLVAAGASAVLDPDAPRRELREQLVELLHAEAAGGLDGPDVGGANAEPRLADFHSASPVMQGFLDLVRRVLDSDATLLVTGETGVGKERLARAIHGESARAAGPFVTVNCGALPENLLESELFGHEKGAFTGADAARPGRFEEAAGGTIFLDEIGEMPQHLQVKLLTVLQRHEIRRLGASEPRPIDVRIVAATNRDLHEDVQEGRFREDLLYRLHVVALEIPPLRQRPEDLPHLIGRTLRHFAAAHDRTDVRDIDGAAVDALLGHDWPGNVREVVNVVERAVLLCRGERIGLADLPADLRGEATGTGGDAHVGVEAAGGAAGEASNEAAFDAPLAEAKRRVVEDFEGRYLRHHLRATCGSMADTARRAGINPRTLYEKMRRLGLRKEDFR